jgi:hypothetical protein
MAADLHEAGGDSVTAKRRTGLVATLSGIADRLR